MRSLLPGLSVVAVIAAAALWTAPLVPGLGGIVLALLWGLVLGAVLPTDRLEPGMVVAEKRGLAVAIVLLGFGFQPQAVGALGAGAWLALVGLIVATIAGAVGLGRWLGLSTPLAWMLGIGQAICGTAAIAATASLVDGEDAEVGLAVGTVNLLGTVGLFTLPALCLMLGSSTEVSALVLGGSLQSMGHAVGAGYAISEDVGLLTVAIKMSRVALLPVLVAGLSLRSAGSLRGVRLPMEVMGFLGAALIASMGLVPARGLQVLDAGATGLLAMAMAAIGARMRLDLLRSQGAAVLGVAGGVFVCQITSLWVLGRWLMQG